MESGRFRIPRARLAGADIELHAYGRGTQMMTIDVVEASKVGRPPRPPDGRRAYVSRPFRSGESAEIQWKLAPVNYIPTMCRENAHMFATIVRHQSPASHRGRVTSRSATRPTRACSTLSNASCSVRLSFLVPAGSADRAGLLSLPWWRKQLRRQVVESGTLSHPAVLAQQTVSES